MASYGFGALNKNLNTKNDYNLKSTQFNVLHKWRLY